MAIGTLGGVKQYVALLGKSGGCVGIAAANGELLWRNNKYSNGTANVPTPIVSGDHTVLYTTGYGDGGTVCLDVTAAGNKAEAAERYSMPAKELQNHHGGVVLFNGFLYGGHGHNNGFPFCMELKTGKQRWKIGRGPGNESAAVLYADGRLIFRYQDGVVALLDANPNGDAQKVLGKFKPQRSGAPAWSHPAIADGVLYLRDQDLLMAYDLKGK